MAWPGMSLDIIIIEKEGVSNVEHESCTNTHRAMPPDTATLFLALREFGPPVLTENPFTSGLYRLIMSVRINSN